MLKDRAQAGKHLASALAAYKDAPDTIVLALPRGGVVVAYEIAEALNLPLDIVVTRKIGHPNNPEYAIGAVAEEGDAIMNEAEIASIDKEWLADSLNAERTEANRRMVAYREGPYPDISGKTVILVDDGVAMGYTMRAAVARVMRDRPSRIIVAVPHGAQDSLVQIRAKVDQLVVLDVPAVYYAVGAHYEEFPQVSDEEVKKLLSNAARKFKV